MQSLLKDLGQSARLKFSIDVRAAKFTPERQGLSKARPPDVDMFWMQDQVARKVLPLVKVPGGENPADMMTKHLARSSVDQCMCQIHQDSAGGRAESVLEVQGSTKKPDSSPAGEAAPPATSNNAPGP